MHAFFLEHGREWMKSCLLYVHSGEHGVKSVTKCSQYCGNCILFSLLKTISQFKICVPLKISRTFLCIPYASIYSTTRPPVPWILKYLKYTVALEMCPDCRNTGWVDLSFYPISTFFVVVYCLKVMSPVSLLRWSKNLESHAHKLTRWQVRSQSLRAACEAAVFCCGPFASMSSAFSCAQGFIE